MITWHYVFGNRFIRFLFVGALNSLFGYSCFAGLLYSGMHYTAALFLATVVGVLFNFRTTGRLVFDSTDDRLIVRFFLCYGIVYLVSLAAIKGMLLLGIGPYYSGAALILPTAALSYVLNRRYVFKK